MNIKNITKFFGLTLVLTLFLSACGTSSPENNNNNNNMNRTLPGQSDLLADYSKAVLKTSKGDITVEFYQESPITVNNFLNLAQAGFYDGTKFHRVISDFMIQGGDPNTKTEAVATYGTGGPDYRFGDEFNNYKLLAGSLAMANGGPNTNGSQFFIVTAEATPWLDGHHTNFGRVTSGMEVVKSIEAVETHIVGDIKDLPVEDIVISSIELKK
jgi:cyclophilin family peptidyl-prolyl cis-trans isomerase